METVLCTERVWRYCNRMTDIVETALCAGSLERYCDGITDIVETDLCSERMDRYCITDIVETVHVLR